MVLAAATMGTTIACGIAAWPPSPVRVALNARAQQRAGPRGQHASNGHTCSAKLTPSTAPASLVKHTILEQPSSLPNRLHRGSHRQVAVNKDGCSGVHAPYAFLHQ